MAGSFFIATLGCPKNEVDSEKLGGLLRSAGYFETSEPAQADLVVVNTCAFIEPAREESIDAILELSALRRPGARLAVTGCLAERSGRELAEALPEVDVVAGFGMDFLGEVATGSKDDSSSSRLGPPSRPVRLLGRGEVPSFDLLELPRPAASAPWAYVKVAEGCDRRCGFCAIPSFRGRQRSRTMASILSEVESLNVREIVLVAQDLASFGRDRSGDRTQLSATGKRGDVAAAGDISSLVKAVAERAERVRLLYLYPSSLSDGLIETIAGTGVPYFDLSLQHVSAQLLRKMRRWGSGGRYLERIAQIRSVAPDAALRSSFILGYPGETEEDQDALLSFLAEAELDWVGFFTFSREVGTYAAALDCQVEPELALERLRECAELQEEITARRRRQLVGATVSVLVDRTGVGRSFREAPEIDGIVRVPARLEPGAFADVLVTGAAGPDLVARAVGLTPEDSHAVGAGTS